MSTFSFFLHYVRRYTAWAVLASAGILVFAAATGATVALIKPIFGEVLLAGDQVPGPVGTITNAPVAEHKGPADTGFLANLKRRLDVAHQIDRGYQSLKRRLGVGPAEVVYFVPLLFVLVFLLRSLADFVSGYAFQHIGLGVTTDIRNDLYRSILGQSSRFHAEHTSGELVARVINDVAMMQNAVSNRLLDLFQQSITLLFLLSLLLSTHFRLAVIALVVAPVLVYPIVRFGKGMRRTSHRSQERMADLASLMTEGVRGHRVVKAFGMEDFEIGKFREATRRHLRVNLWAQMLANSSGPVVESLAVVGAAGLLIYAGRAIRSGELSAPELIQFLTTLLMMYDPIRKLNKVNLILQEAMAAGQRVARLTAIPNDIVEKPGAREVATVREGIAYERVTFGYEERQVLHDVTIRIRAGEIVALVGPSGAGKSTLVNLLPRFFDPDGGRVAIDGLDIRDLKLKSLRALIGIVTQDTVLFNDSIRNNIAYGRLDLPLERVREAAAAAYADEFIMQLPSGYGTRDRGVRRAAVGRPAAAAGHRPRPAQERADPDPRRSHLPPGHGVRVAGPEGALEPDAGPDDTGHRAPPLDRDAGRPHRGGGQRPDRGGGLAQRADGPGRHLPPAVRSPVPGMSSEDGGDWKTAGALLHRRRFHPCAAGERPAPASRRRAAAGAGAAGRALHPGLLAPPPAADALRLPRAPDLGAGEPEWGRRADRADGGPARHRFEPRLEQPGRGGGDAHAAAQGRRGLRSGFHTGRSARSGEGGAAGGDPGGGCDRLADPAGGGGRDPREALAVVGPFPRPSSARARTLRLRRAVLGGAPGRPGRGRRGAEAAAGCGRVRGGEVGRRSLSRSSTRLPAKAFELGL